MDWDPEVAERIYVRSKRTGDLGWLVRRGGVDMVRLDRPNEVLLQKYQPDLWPSEDMRAPYSLHQVVRVAFEADKRLAFALGEHQDAKADWNLLTERKRIDLVQGGPPPGRHPLRYQLWDAILELLSEHAR
jgi:hypothetical protein